LADGRANSAAWLGQIETWCSILAAKSLVVVSFDGVKYLIDQIDHFIAICNENVRPSQWIKSLVH
jgi:hypothetical protein